VLPSGGSFGSQNSQRGRLRICAARKISGQIFFIDAKKGTKMGRIILKMRIGAKYLDIYAENILLSTDIL
jgi:hypothetical protein